MDEQLMEELAGWDELVAAGTVAPVDPRVLEKVRSEVRQVAERADVEVVPRRRRWGLAAAAAATAAAVVGVLVLLGHGPDEQPAVGPAPSTPHVPAASCVEGYSLTNLTHRSLAFDGTVERVSAVDGPAGAKFDRHEVLFLVNRWYRGGTGRHVTVITTGNRPADKPSLQVGRRLLVSGETQSAAPPLAWTGCGFTRPYDQATAADWESVLKR
ncbi:hypothetical protein ACQHIV_10300 [Kribbella sp. GL6]|uniref:hypothetical protein n=1 Tax=Kribbella sp. GL6 TaxID=3419765 RepID=UPI003D091AFC